MLTLQNLYDDFYSKTGLTTSDIATSAVLPIINQKYNDLAQIITEVNEDFFATSTTTSMVSGARLFALPTDLLKVKRVEVSYTADDWRNAEYIDLNAAGIATDDTTIKANFTTEEPKFDLWGSNLDLLPPATANVSNGFKLYYIQQPTALSAVGDSPNIALQGFEQLISNGAIVTIATKLGLQDLAATYTQLWEQGKLDLRRQLQNRALGENLGFTPISENRE